MALNLSCGKCRAIQPFSGTPPACEVCGWVRSTTNMRAVPTSSTALGETLQSNVQRSYTPQLNTPQVTAPPSNAASQSSGWGTAFGCLGGIVVLAFYAACVLIVIALAVWAWRYLFG